MKPTRYFKVVCSHDGDLGYEELYGDGQRYFWTQADAIAQAKKLNSDADRLILYEVRERSTYEDGRFDDEYDDFAHKQLGMW